MSQKSSHHQKALLYLEKNALSLYIPGKEAIVKLAFPDTVVRAGDIVDKNAFLTLLQTVVSSNAVQSVNIIVVVGQSLLFTKDIVEVVPPVTQPITQPITQPAVQPVPAVPIKKVTPPTTAELAAKESKERAEIQAFVDKVPFEHVFYKTLKLPTGVRVFATSGDLLESLQEAFHTSNSLVESAFPTGVFDTSITFQNGLTVDIAKQVILKVDSMRQYNLFESLKPVQISSDGEVIPVRPSLKHAKDFRLFIMIGVFVVLIGILIFFFVRMNAENEALMKKVTPTPAAILPTESVSPLPTIASSSQSAVFSQSTHVHILTTSQTTSQVPLLQTDLEELGIRQITAANSISSSAASIQFSPSIPESAQDTILTIVRKYIPNAVSSQATDTTYDVLISF